MRKLEKIHQKAAGIDLGSEMIFISLDNEPVKSYPTFTSSYRSAIAYLQEHQVTTVAMEATGVYWISFYEMLEQEGMEVYLVNPRDCRNVPGRKTDVQDCQWIHQLHSYGLLRNSFIPEENIRQLRCYNRIREDHIQMAASHIQHMQKALTLMNIKVHHVISQIHGASGLRIVEAILSGQTDVEYLVSLCDVQILRHKRKEVALSLEGNYKEEHLFLLRQAYECWQHYQEKIVACDKQIEQVLKELAKDKEKPVNITPAKRIKHHKPEIANFHELMLTITGGIDQTTLPGFTDYNLMYLIGEIGLDVNEWSSEKNFTSWLGLAPGKNSSGKMTGRSKKRPNTRAGQIFKQAAQSVLKSKHLALGAFGRRIRARRGPAIAIKAIARKLAEMYYRMRTKGIEYVEQGIKAYEAQQKEQTIKYLKKKAMELNLQLVEC